MFYILANLNAAIRAMLPASRFLVPGMHMSLAEYGFDHFTYVAGQRYRVGRTRTLRPEAGESNGAFEARMDALVQGLAQLGADSVEMNIEIRGGAFVACSIVVKHAPLKATPGMAEGMAGGRFSGERGSRGRTKL